MALRKVQVTFLADTKDLEAGMARASVVSEKAGRDIGDRFTEGTSKAAHGIDKLRAQAESLDLPFAHSLGAVSKKFDDAQAHCNKFNTVLGALGKTALLAGGAGIGAVGAEALKMGVNFQQATISIQNSARISSTAAQNIGKAFLATAGKSTFSAQEMAAAYGQVAGKLGQAEHAALTTAQATAFMKQATDLAEASQTDLGTATTALTRIMGPYHIAVGQASTAANVLYNTSRLTQVPLNQLSSSLTRLHGRLGILAPSLTDVGALMTKLNSFGITGARAMMQVNTAFQTLVGSSKKVHSVLADLGASVYDSQGKFVGLQSVIQQLRPKIEGLTQQQQLYVSQTLFGKQAGQAMLQIIEAGVPSWQQATRAVQAHNSMQSAAERQAHTLQGELNTMRSTVQDLGTQLGLWLIPKFTQLVGTIQTVVSWFEKHREAAIALGSVIAGVLGSAITMFVGTKVKAFIGGISSMVSMVSTGASAIATKFGLVGSSSAAMATEVATSEEAVTATTEATATACDTALMSTGIGAALVALGIAAGELGAHWGSVMGGMKDAVNWMVQAAETALNGLISALNSAISVFNSTVGQITGAIGKVGQVGVSPAFGNNPSPFPSGSLSSNFPVLSTSGTLQGSPAWGGGAVPVPTSGSNAQRIAGALARQGFSKVAIAGILGNFAQETGGGSLASINTRDTGTGASGMGGMGIAQWTMGRRLAEISYANAHHEGATSLAAQIGFLVQELRTSRHSAFTAIQGASSPQAAAQLFNQLFEGGTDPGGVRERAAAQAMQMLGSGGGVGGGNSAIQGLINASQGGAGGKATMRYWNHMPVGKMTQAQWQAWLARHPATTKSLLYANPLSGDQYNVERTDQGKDYGSIHGNIGAIGAGIVTLAQNIAGFGQTIVERLTQGPNKGRYIYYGLETGAAGVGLRQGQTVRAGQTVARGLGTGGVEFGFWNPQTGHAMGYQPGVTSGAVTPAGTAFAQWMAQLAHGNVFTTTNNKTGVVTGGGANISATLGQLEQAFTAALLKAGNALLQKYQQITQYGTVKTLSAALGLSTGGSIAVTRHTFGTAGLTPTGWGGYSEPLSTALQSVFSHLSPTASLGRIYQASNGLVAKGVAGSAQERSYQQRVLSLLADGQKNLAERLVAAHKAAMAALGQELYAAQVTKDAELLQLAGTQEKDRTSLMANTAAAQLQIVKDSNQASADAITASTKQSADATRLMADSMQAAATSIKDQTAIMTDSFTAMAQAVADATALMADTSNTVVQGISDNTQVRVDILGERGLYGLNLIAQKEQVQLDQAKASFDQQINVAKQSLDVVKATWDTAVAAAQANVDQVQLQEDTYVAQAQQNADTVQLSEDSLVSAAQAHADAVQVAQDQKLARAQAHVDTVTLAQDIAVQLAQTAVDLSATAPKAQQDVVNAQLRHAQARAFLAEGYAQAGLAGATAQANAAITQAQGALTYAQATAAAAEGQAQGALVAAQGAASAAAAEAQGALAKAQGEASVAIASAQQTLQGIQDTAAQTEATLQGQVNITKAEASTQYAGSGLVVNMYGINPADAAANASELGWVLRTQVPA